MTEKCKDVKSVLNDLVSVVCSCQVPLDRMKGPTLTSGATTVTLSTAMALRFKDLMEDELHTNTKHLIHYYYNLYYLFMLQNRAE